MLSMPLYGARFGQNPALHITGEVFNARLPFFRALRALFVITKRNSEDFDMPSLLRNNDLLDLISYACVRSEEAEGSTDAFYAASSILYEMAMGPYARARYFSLSQIDCYQSGRLFRCAGKPTQLVSLFLDGCVLTDEQFEWLLSSQQAK